MRSYDYAHRRGIENISWERFSRMAARLTEALADAGADLILGGAREAVAASLVAHSWADPHPNVAALVSDALIVFPWDRRVFQDGKWRTYPEIVAARRLQKKRGGGPEP